MAVELIGRQSIVPAPTRSADNVKHQNFIERLPNELLESIAALLSLEERSRVTKVKHFKALHPLSHVSRRFRLVVLPLLWRNLDFGCTTQFYDFMSHVNRNKQSQELCSYVRFVVCTDTSRRLAC